MIVVNKDTCALGWDGNVIPVRHWIFPAIGHLQRKGNSPCHRIYQLVPGHGIIMFVTGGWVKLLAGLVDLLGKG